MTQNGAFASTIKRNRIMFGMKKKVLEAEFVGRHQQHCAIKGLLGEKVPAMELQIATNEDESERDNILKKLEEEEEYIRSDLFSNQYAVEIANKNARELLDEGYKTCVFTNDRDLESRCLHIFDATNEYLERALRKKEDARGAEFADASEAVRSMLITQGLVQYILLGGLLEDSSAEQKLWVIMNSLTFSNALVKESLSLLPSGVAKEKAVELERFSAELLQRGKISHVDQRKIATEIQDGLALSGASSS